MNGISHHTVKASELTVERCQTIEARLFIEAHHSRLPRTQRGPWKYAFCASHPTTRQIYATALWNNPSARMLPNDWLELRRMAVSNDAPHCTASSFLSAMVRQLRSDGHRHFISYQDLDVHTGTIYKAAGWHIEYVSKPRVRKRGYSEARGRNYRTSINGQTPDAAGKARWALCYGCPTCESSQ